MSDCRCGWDGFGVHPCHGGAYTCGKPAKQRFVANNAALAGMQMKVGATDTYACDECWAEFRKLQAQAV